jgi:hypothetical protein
LSTPLRITIDSELLSRPQELQQYLEEFYVKGGEYILEFSHLEHKKIDKVFDNIIRIHGLKSNIDFFYEISGPE